MLANLSKHSLLGHPYYSTCLISTCRPQRQQLGEEKYVCEKGGHLLESPSPSCEGNASVQLWFLLFVHTSLIETWIFHMLIHHTARKQKGIKGIEKLAGFIGTRFYTKHRLVMTAKYINMPSRSGKFCSTGLYTYRVITLRFVYGVTHAFL